MGGRQRPSVVSPLSRFLPDASQILLRVSRQIVCTRLQDLGDAHKVGRKAIAPTETRKPRVRKHLIDLEKASPGGREDGAVLPFVDGDFCRASYWRTRSWHVENRTKSSVRSEAGRVVIAHTITRDSPLVGGFLHDQQGFSRRERRFIKRDGRRSSGGSGVSPRITGDLTSGRVEPGKARGGEGHYMRVTREPLLRSSTLTGTKRRPTTVGIRMTRYS